MWNDYIVGFFLDRPLYFTAVVEHLKRLWKLKGSVKVKFNGTIFTFLLSSGEDKARILRGNPIIMRNKIFIIQEWSPDLGNACGKLNAIPMWV